MSHKYVVENGRKLVTVIAGDGIGPEVVKAARQAVDATTARITWDEHEAGAAVFAKGDASGVPLATIESISKTGVILKGPLETPVGYGGKSANVTLRTLFETYANIRPVRELPGIVTPFSGRNIDLVVVRENVEDLYAGVEHMQTPGVAQGLKLITRKGSEKIIRFAFELAKSEGRKKVHCATKANIMKLTEGLFKKTFEDVAQEYPDIQAEHIIIDNCCHQLVRRPEQFDVIVTTNMNGDIVSDLTSGLVGGLGFAPSANIGQKVAIFEAVHGSAPDIAGKGLANPTALLLTAVQMLRYLDEFAAATQLEGAILTTLSEGVLTGDVAKFGTTAASTESFTQAVIQNLGRTPSTGMPQRVYKKMTLPHLRSDIDFVKVDAEKRHEKGVDIFLESAEHAGALAKKLIGFCEKTPFTLTMISNRGAAVYPASPGQLTDCVDHYRCRFALKEVTLAKDFPDAELFTLLSRIAGLYRWMHVEKLLEINNTDGFSKAQGEK
jgi:isocitrate dehydrogenase